MTDKQKLERIKALADAMYDAAFNLTIDANQLMKSLHDYHQFIINEYHKEDPVSNDLENAAIEWFDSVKYKSNIRVTLIIAFKAGAKWQKGKDKEEWMEKALDFFESNYNSLIDGGVIGVFDDKKKMIEEFVEFMNDDNL